VSEAPRYSRDQGVELFDQVYRGDVGPLPQQGDSKFIDYMLETLFGTLWADGTLSIRERRLLLIGAIAALGDAMTLKIQLRAALKGGELTPQQVEAATIFLTQYVGYPRGSQMFGIANELLQELKQP